MDRIIRGRGTGKTRELMEKVRDNDGILVCVNPEGMRKKAENYGIVGLEIISYTDYYLHPFLDALKPSEEQTSKRKYYIDELETFLQCCIVGDTFEGYTLTNED